MTSRLLLIGSGGQVGWELARSLAPLGEVISRDRDALDLTDFDALRSTIQGLEPDVVINAAAHTRVDQAETEPELAMRVNGEAPGVMAEAAKRISALLVHFSTDYVFGGDATRPYREEDAPAPMTAYGRSKLAGEQAVLEQGTDAWVFRVGWVYGRRGRNFFNTIARLSREQQVLRVVADQHGSPTWSGAIAQATTGAIASWLTAGKDRSEAAPAGLYHMAAPDHTTWHGFASAIVDAMPPATDRPPPVVEPIPSTEYPTPALRPSWSVLDSTRLKEVFGLSLPGWRTQLAACIDEDEPIPITPSPDYPISEDPKAL